MTYQLNLISLISVFILSLFLCLSDIYAEKALTISYRSFYNSEMIICSNNTILKHFCVGSGANINCGNVKQ